jgi:hypothetical protein
MILDVAGQQAGVDRERWRRQAKGDEELALVPSPPRQSMSAEGVWHGAGSVCPAAANVRPRASARRSPVGRSCAPRPAADSRERLGHVANLVDK